MYKKGLQCAQTHTARTKYVKEVVGGKLSDLHVTRHARIHPQCNDGDFTNEAKQEGKIKILNGTLRDGKSSTWLVWFNTSERAIEVTDRTGS